MSPQLISAEHGRAHWVYEGLIELPAPRRRFERLRSYARRTPQGEPGARIEAPLSALGTVRLELVERAGSALWNELIDRCH